MPFKNVLKRNLPLLGLVGLTFLIALLWYFILNSFVQNGSILTIKNAVALQKPEQSNSGLLASLASPTGEIVGKPVRLKIPSININTPVESVGRTSDGAMDVPNSPLNVAWFNLGPLPGANGSAVIAGHYDGKNNRPAVFFNLHQLRQGDEIYIEDETGANTIFIVREIKIYNKDENAANVFGSSDGKAHLNLITCAGAWNKTEQTRADRLIVFTDKK